MDKRFQSIIRIFHILIQFRNYYEVYFYSLTTRRNKRKHKRLNNVIAINYFERGGFCNMFLRFRVLSHNNSITFRVLFDLEYNILSFYQAVFDFALKGIVFLVISPVNAHIRVFKIIIYFVCSKLENTFVSTYLYLLEIQIICIRLKFRFETIIIKCGLNQYSFLY